MKVKYEVKGKVICPNCYEENGIVFRVWGDDKSIIVETPTCSNCETDLMERIK